MSTSRPTIDEPFSSRSLSMFHYSTVIPRIMATVLMMAFTTVPAAAAEERPKADSTGRTESFVYKTTPPRKLTVHYPDGWQRGDRRSALVIFRCRIPVQREHFRKLGMVVIKPQLAPVNSGQLPQLSLREIATLPRPRHQVEDTKSTIRYLRAHADALGIDPNRIVATGTSGGGDLALQSAINDAFENDGDDLTVSPRPNGLVLYCPAFDGIDIWFVRTATLLKKVRETAPAFEPHLDRFVRLSAHGYAIPVDHRANLITRAQTFGRHQNIPNDQIKAFQKSLELFNVRDWQLLHPVEDAVKMSATRILPGKPLPPTLIMYGDRDHLVQYQNAFVQAARAAGQKFEVRVYPAAGHSFMTQLAYEKPSTLEAEQFLRSHGFLPAVKSSRDGQ